MVTGLLEVFRKNAKINNKEININENKKIDVEVIKQKSRFIGFETNLRKTSNDKNFS